MIKWDIRVESTLANNYSFAALESLTKHAETQPEQATVVPQAQPQPIYYYAPYPQAPAVNQAP